MLQLSQTKSYVQGHPHRLLVVEKQELSQTMNYGQGRLHLLL